MKAYKSLIKSALAAGYHVRVDDGGETIRCNDSYKLAVEAVESVDGASLLLVSAKPRKESGKYVLYGSALVISGLAAEESVADYSACLFIDRWFDRYYDDNSYVFTPGDFELA